MKVLRFCFTAFVLLVSLSTYGQRMYSGIILDSQDLGFLEGVHVQSLPDGDVSVSNARGYFAVRAAAGDSLSLSMIGFLTQKIVLGEELFLTVKLQDKARFLPTVQVEATPYSYRFKDGKLVLREENEVVDSSPKGEMTLAPNASGDGSGGIALNGFISYFTKKAKQQREYARKMRWHARRKGYYAVIQSDSVRMDFSKKYGLSDESWNRLVIRFNQFHQAHEFLDWSSERVWNSLDEFLLIEAAYLD